MAEGDLSVKADELVEIVCMFEDGWSKCRLLIDQSQEGFIPTAFLLVDQVEDGAEEEEESIPDQPSYPPQQSFEVEMIVDIRSPLSSSIYSPSGPLVSSSWLTDDNILIEIQQEGGHFLNFKNTSTRSEKEKV